MYFHAMNRGALRGAIFRNDDDRAFFVQLMGKYALEYGVRLLAWALMPNHIHAEPDSEGTPLCEMMRDLERTYAQSYNKKYGGSGCLFQGPFKTTAIGSPDGLAYVSRYIHLNPKVLGVRPEDYPWSSCRSYLGLAPVPPWLDPCPVLGVTRREGMSDIDSYRAYLAEAPPRISATRPEETPFVEFDLEMIRYLDSSYAEMATAIKGMSPHLALQTAVAWAASTRFRIPAATIAAYYGFANPAVVRTLVSRFKKKLEDQPDLSTLLKRVS
jgi:hypothetical protein